MSSLAEPEQSPVDQALPSVPLQSITTARGPDFENMSQRHYRGSYTGRESIILQEET